MAAIRQDDLIPSAADALQFISYYHPPDFMRAMAEACEKEESPAAGAALQQVLVNSRMRALGKRPICQHTGIVIVFLDVGMAVRMDVRWDGNLSVKEMVNEGVRSGFMHPDNLLRGSVLADPDGARTNTGDNTPAVIHTRLVPGDGSEAKAQFAVLNPSDSVADWVLSVVPEMRAGWCPPGVLGVGIGGTPEKTTLLAKEAMMEPIDIDALRARGAGNRQETLRLELYEKVNALDVGAQGLGGLTTVLDVKVREYPSLAASKPVAVIPNCTATRHLRFSLDGSGPARFEPPDLADWPDIGFELEEARRVDLDTLTRERMRGWRAGDTLPLSGSMLTGRDAARMKIADPLERGGPLPVDFRGRFIYYVGPVDPVRDEVAGPTGPTGPTTATRIDKLTGLMLERTGLPGMIGKAGRGPEAIAAIREHEATSLIAVGGAAYLISQAITGSGMLAFPVLGMEAIREFQVRDMPVTVALGCRGNSVHIGGPKAWARSAGERIEAVSVS